MSQSCWQRGPQTYANMSCAEAERISRGALEEPNRHAALHFLAQALPTLETAVLGLNNAGLLAVHELQMGARRRTDWPSAMRKAREVRGKRDLALIAALGFRVGKLDNLTFLLYSAEQCVAVAVALKESETAELDSERFNGLSPISYAMAKADSTDVPWVLAVQGAGLRLFPTASNVGVARRPRMHTSIQCHSQLLADENLPYLWLLFSAEALVPGGSITEILEASRRFAAALAGSLRERMYDEAMPAIARGIAKALNISRPTPGDLFEIHETALLVLFRLLFVAYADDRDLLPYRFNEAYRRHSLKQLAQELSDPSEYCRRAADGESLWPRILRLWAAVADGNPAWEVPAYGGGLFSDDPAVSPAGSTLAVMKIPDADIETVLRALLVADTPEGIVAPIDFRFLGPREFGTIYEGLPESELALAEQSLVRRPGGDLAPAGPGDDIAVAKGKMYLRPQTGKRKLTCSYYTPAFAVEHLLDGALEPALAEHFTRLTAMSDADAARAFFDFRVADIEMGSGHFLVAAIDRIEATMLRYLGARPLTGVASELANLRTIARRRLGGLADATGIGDSALMRRLVAQRCIYGVDASAHFAQLARLSVFVHTLVPGLPLPFLDRTLTHGDSVAGVGAIGQLVEQFSGNNETLFPTDAQTLLGAATPLLDNLADRDDATRVEVETSRALSSQVQGLLREVHAWCDRVPPSTTTLETAPNSSSAKLRSAVEREIANAENALPFHFPVRFPEIFLRERAGFDVVLGNPPWNEPNQSSTMVRKRADLYLPFFNRFWDLTCSNCGRIGAVLPRGMLASASKGCAESRRTMFLHSAAVQVDMIENRGGWVFSDAAIGHFIGLVCIARGEPEQESVTIRGPFESQEAFDQGRRRKGQSFDAHSVLGWGGNAALPLLPLANSADVFAQAGKAPRLDLVRPGQWRARPSPDLTKKEINLFGASSGDELPFDHCPIYKSSSFGLWTSDTKIYAGSVEPGLAREVVYHRRLKSARNRGSAHGEFSLDHLRDLAGRPGSLFASGPIGPVAVLSWPLSFPQVYFSRPTWPTFSGRRETRETKRSCSGFCRQPHSTGTLAGLSRSTLALPPLTPSPYHAQQEMMRTGNELSPWRDDSHAETNDSQSGHGPLESIAVRLKTRRKTT